MFAVFIALLPRQFIHFHLITLTILGEGTNYEAPRSPIFTILVTFPLLGSNFIVGPFF
jgi:hypothetical protein